MGRTREGARRAAAAGGRGGARRPGTEEDRREAAARGGIWAATFAAALALQWPFMYADVPGGDAGELLSEACSLGVAHPPGYPAFVLLWHVFMQAAAPALDPARAASLCSILCGSGASGFVALAVWDFPRIGGAPPRDEYLEKAAAFMAGLAFSMSPLVWTYTVGAEVFALNNLLCGAVLYLTVSLGRDSIGKSVPSGSSAAAPSWTSAKIILGAALSGLALSNQHTSVLFLIPLVPYAVWVLDPRPVSVARYVGFGLAGLVGLLPYAHVYAAASSPRAGSWGATDSVAGLWQHFSRSEYGTLTLSGHVGPSEGFAERTWAYLDDLVGEELGALYVAGPLLALYGAAQSVATRPGPGLMAAYIFYFGVFHSLANLPLSMPMPREVHRRFWIQPHLIVCIWFGLGVSYASDVLFRQGMRQRGPVAALLGVMTLALVLRQADLARQTPTGVVGVFADTALAGLPEGALVASHTDINWNSFRFKQVCAGARPDVTHISFQLMPYPWFAIKQAPLYPDVEFPPLARKGMSTSRGSDANSKMVVDFALANAPRRPAGVYIDLHSINDGQLGADNYYPGGVFLLPHGLLWRVYPANAVPTTEPAQGEAHGSSPSSSSSLKSSSLSGARPLLQDAWLAGWQDRTRPLCEKVLHAIETATSSPVALPPETAAWLPSSTSGVLVVEGSWEYAALCILWDAVYQRALFLLSAALERGPDSEVYALALAESAGLLNRIVSEVAISGTISVSHADVAKNAALASIRWMQHAVHTDPEQALQAEAMALGCLRAFRRMGDPSDPVYPKFVAVLEALERTRAASGGAT